MKKIVSLIVLFFMAIILIGCYESTGEVHIVEFFVENELFDTQEVVDGSKAEEIIPYEINGYEFEYWTLDSKQYYFNQMIKSSIKLDAKYKEIVDITDENKYTVSFNTNGGSFIEDIIVLENNSVNRPKDPKRSGYSFVEWQLNGLKYEFNNLVKENLILDAVWKKEDTNINVNGKLNIFYLNDTHGAILNSNDEIGLSRIGNLIIDEFNNNPNDTLFLAGGDMFQGQLVSNDNKGALMVELLNEMKLDAFTLGNHEFDWGIDVVLEYFNPNTSGVKANFPVLGANIFKKSDDQLLDYVEPYTIVEKNNLKVGIIGVIGYGLESSIMLPRVSDYYFSEPSAIVEKYTKELREEKDVDIVIVNIHGDDYSFDSRVANFSGNSKVDVVLKGHTHRVEHGHLSTMPFLQAGSNGKYLGRVEMPYQIINNNFTSNRANSVPSVIDSDIRFNTENKNLNNIIDKYSEAIYEALNVEIIKAQEYMSKSSLSKFISRVMKTYTNADIAIHNNGGTRATFEQGLGITAADVFKVFPFDNRIVLVEVTGRDLNGFYRGNWLTHYTDKSSFNNNETYLVATNDYVYFGNKDSFNNDSHQYYELDLYELLLKVLKDLRDSGLKEFNVNTPLPIIGA